MIELGAKVVKADVPLSEMFGYVTTLRTIVFWSCNFKYGVLTLLQLAPRNIADEVIAKVQGKSEA
jgi:elongation factor G